MTISQCIDPDMLLKSYDVSLEAISAKDSCGNAKALIPDVTTRRVQGEEPRKLLFVDTSKAYLHAPVMRTTYTSSCHLKWSSQDAVGVYARRCMGQERQRGAGNKNTR